MRKLGIEPTTPTRNATNSSCLKGQNKRGENYVEYEVKIIYFFDFFNVSILYRHFLRYVDEIIPGGGLIIFEMAGNKYYTTM